MKLKKNKKGFTLLEIMIVVIIVGVLAALALPRLFGTIEYSRSTEAFAALSAVRSAMERCYLEPQSFTGCTDFDDLDIPDPGDSPGAHFTYSIEDQTASVYTIEARRATTDGGVLNDCVGLNQTATAVNKCGTEAFGKIGAVTGCCD